MMVFSARKTSEETTAAARSFCTMLIQFSVSPCDRLNGLRVINGLKVARAVTAQPTSDSGISSFFKTVAYLRTPELTTPTNIWKTKGRKWATILATQREHQRISTCSSSAVDS